MSVAYEHRAFHDSPYAPVGEHDHDHDVDDADQDMTKYINTEANVDDMADLAAATYEPHAHSNDEPHDAPSPFFKISSADTLAPTIDLGPARPPNVDPSNVPIRAALPMLEEGGGGSGARNSSHSPPPRSPRVKKPRREVSKNDAGLFECTFAACKEKKREYARKCEWSKHMDKHERPYHCVQEGCETLQGFTYSGGLLRHEREVHKMHGGPKNVFVCPHDSCKRYNGEIFSRYENLLEHLRRVHDVDPPVRGGRGAKYLHAAAAARAQQRKQQHSPVSVVTHSDAASVAFAAMTTLGSSPGPSPGDASAVVTPPGAGSGYKRKRRSRADGDGQHHQHEDSMKMALLEENTTLREENEDLKRLNQELRAQLESYQAQVDIVQAAISGLQGPVGAGL